MAGGRDQFILPALEGLPLEIREQALQNYRVDLAQKIKDHKSMYGVAMTDVAGHENEALIVNAAFHQALLTGVLDHLSVTGEVPVALFENLNTRFQNTEDFESHIALIYGEIAESGRFRYIAANSHAPILFSAQYNAILHLQDTHESSFPIGFALSEFTGADENDDEGTFTKPPYKVNELQIASGDILVLYSDGLHDHELGDGSRYISNGLEQLLRANKERSAQYICDRIREDVTKDPREDDVSYTIIKKE